LGKPSGTASRTLPSTTSPFLPPRPDRYRGGLRLCIDKSARQRAKGGQEDPASAGREFVRRESGRPVSVGEAARRLGYSTRHASALFRQETGIGLKRFLDEERVLRAYRLVRFSDLAIKQIADRMGFSDSFSFLRFFRRVRGASPSTVREANAEDLAESAPRTPVNRRTRWRQARGRAAEVTDIDSRPPPV
jgi:AraC-like DNA-binding protein